MKRSFSQCRFIAKAKVLSLTFFEIGSKHFCLLRPELHLAKCFILMFYNSIDFDKQVFVILLHIVCTRFYIDFNKQDDAQ